MVSDNSPEWLPSGWTMQVRDRHGRRIKSYLDPESGRKFYSKPEVSRYLETVKNSTSCDKSPKPHATTADLSTKQDYNQGNEIPDPSPEGQAIEQQNGDKYTLVIQDAVDCLTGDGDLSESAASEENEVSDWLPDGWIMEVKTQKVGTKMRLIYKCFIEPESGRKFFSKSQVLSYLSNKNTSESGQREACTNTRNEVSEWLPDGWIMEVKTCSGGTREYKCYTDPPSGRKFFSKRQVLNYLATTNSSGAEQIKGDKASPKPDKAQNSEAIDFSRNKSKKKTAIPKVISRTPADGLPPGWIKEIRIRKYAHYTTKDPYYLDPLSGYMFRSKPDALRYLDTGDIRKCIIKPKKRDINEELPKSICAVDGLKPVSTDTRRQLFQGKEASSDAAVDSIVAAVNLEENHTHEKCIDPETQASLIAENTSVSTPPNDILQEIGSPEEKIAEHSKQMNTSKKKSTFTLPARSSKRLKGLEPEIKCDPFLNEQAIRAAACGVPKRFEEQVEKDTIGSTRHLDNNEAGEDGKARMANVEEQTDNGNAESQISSLLGVPYVEFAIKTLRGEIPVDSRVGLETSKNERQTKVN